MRTMNRNRACARRAQHRSKFEGCKTVKMCIHIMLPSMSFTIFLRDDRVSEALFSSICEQTSCTVVKQPPKMNIFEEIHSHANKVSLQDEINLDKMKHRLKLRRRWTESQ